ncbi:MAG: nucleoside phosphorylase [Bacteroidia bacterium]|nr:nucleoside phosphorylase [Bacteroidia bacterium]
MHSKQIEPSELIINPDGSVFHLHLLPEQIAESIILVGDPGRVEMVSSYFSKIEHKVSNREFFTHTGIFNGKRVSVLSTGIGTDNIDIVVNELDALVNIDLKKREIKEDKKSLTLIRLGTSGGLQEDVFVDSFLVSQSSIGFDGLLNYYQNRNKISNLDFEKAFTEFMDWNPLLPKPYVVDCCKNLMEKLGKDFKKGVTISASGFYGPQGRVLRLPIADPEINNKIEKFNFNGRQITNYEMESSALYGLSKLLGHHALTICAIIANRVSKTYSKDYKPIVRKLVEHTLEKLTE